MPQTISRRLHLRQWTTRLTITAIAMSLGQPQSATAQVIGNHNTTVNFDGNQFNISSNAISGPNHFFSLTQFSLGTGETAIFQNTATASNVLAKVTGGMPSNIQGTIGFTNGAPNLYLLNPAGIIFGPKVELNLPGSFTATTASGIRIGPEAWWDMNSSIAPTAIDQPTALRFSAGTPGTIVNLGNIGAGSNLSLIGGTVINAGNLATQAEGSINLAATPGNIVQKIVPGGLLSIEIIKQPIPSLGFTPATLPELITGSGNANASQVIVNPNGTVSLSLDRPNLPPRSVTITAGDVYTTTIAAPERILLQASGYVYGNDLSVRDIKNGARIEISGDQGIDLGQLKTSATTLPEQLISQKRAGWINLKSAAGNVGVSTIDNPIGRIDIAARGIFQATDTFDSTQSVELPLSINSYNGVSIYYNQTIPELIQQSLQGSDSINQSPFTSRIEIQGGENTPFIVGPDAVQSLPVRTWLSRGISGTTGAIQIDPQDGSNNPIMILQSQSFGRLPDQTPTVRIENLPTPSENTMTPIATAPVIQRTDDANQVTSSGSGDSRNIGLASANKNCPAQDQASGDDCPTTEPVDEAVVDGVEVNNDELLKLLTAQSPDR
jgi:filamentous hemagglutinin family protein